MLTVKFKKGFGNKYTAIIQPDSQSMVTKPVDAEFLKDPDMAKAFDDFKSGASEPAPANATEVGGDVPEADKGDNPETEDKAPLNGGEDDQSNL